jgi:hypothetical protein
VIVADTRSGSLLRLRFFISLLHSMRLPHIVRSGAGPALVRPGHEPLDRIVGFAAPSYGRVDLFAWAAQEASEEMVGRGFPPVAEEMKDEEEGSALLPRGTRCHIVFDPLYKQRNHVCAPIRRRAQGLLREILRMHQLIEYRGWFHRTASQNR